MADALLQVVTDLVQGEFMQLGSKETENERFAHYLTKTYRKTASLIANSIKAVSSVVHWCNLEKCEVGVTVTNRRS
jgi:geranylgeranyl pyrophosphate synthase